MIAIEIARPGPPDVLTLVERPDPEPGPGDVLIRVAAAGVNRPDVMQRKGLYPPPPGASDLPGLEVAGTIVATGSGVTEWRVGDDVCALVPGGGYAALCVAPAPQCLPVPRGMDLTTAAAIPETYFTVWTNVFDRGRLRPGEWALVHGGSSGIGTTAIQLAAARGALVVATAGSDEKCRVCESLGAQRAINYRRESFRDVIRQLTSDRGVDLVLDIVGGHYFADNLMVLATDGRLVQIGLMDGERLAQIDLARVLGRRLTITGSTLRPRIHATFPLAQAATAHALMESSEHAGKIVLTIGD